MIREKSSGLTFLKHLKILVLIVGQYCSVYEKGLGRVSVDLFRNCSECPLIYNSTESWICKMKFTEIM